jgi:hypothetical protein
MRELMDAVRQYVDGFNRGDVKTIGSTFAVPGMVLDGMAPYVWHGATVAQDWYRDVLVEGEQHGASEYVVSLNEPRHDWRDLHGGSSQAQRRVAHSGLGMGKRLSIAAQMIASGRDFARDL